MNLVNGRIQPSKEGWKLQLASSLVLNQGSLLRHSKRPVLLCFCSLGTLSFKKAAKLQNRNKTELVKNLTTKLVIIYFKLKRAVFCYSSRTCKTTLQYLQNYNYHFKLPRTLEQLQSTTSVIAESTYTSSAAEDISVHIYSVEPAVKCHKSSDVGK